MKQISLLPLCLRKGRIVFVLSMLLLAQMACSFSKTPVAPTLPPVATTIAPSETPAATATPVPTDTPEPTATRTPDFTATAVVENTAQAEKKIAEIEPELKKLGFSTTSGNLIFKLKEEKVLSVDTYNSDISSMIIDHPVSDFVTQAKVEWHSSGGLAGCEIIFRAEDDLKNGASYRFPIMRLMNRPLWDIEYVKFGEWQETLTFGKVQVSNQINDEQDSTNVLTLVVQGDKITPYLNGEKQRTLTHTKLTNGLIGWDVFQESGSTTCTFKSGWVWELK